MVGPPSRVPFKLARQTIAGTTAEVPGTLLQFIPWAFQLATAKRSDWPSVLDLRVSRWLTQLLCGGPSGVSQKCHLCFLKTWQEQRQRGVTCCRPAHNGGCKHSSFLCFFLVVVSGCEERFHTQTENQRTTRDRD